MKRFFVIICTLLTQQWFDPAVAKAMAGRLGCILSFGRRVTMHRIVFIICTLSLSKGAISAAFNPKEREPQRVASLQQLCRTAVAQNPNFATDVLPALFKEDTALSAERGNISAMRINNALLKRISMQSSTLLDHTAPIHSVAFSPDGTMLAAGSRDFVAHLCDVATGVSRSLRGHQAAVNSVAFSPDGLTVASGSDDATVRLWDVKAGTCLHTFRGNSRFTTVAFSPDGTILAAGTRESLVYMWNIASRTRSHILSRGGLDTIQSLSFSPDGAIIAVGRKGRDVHFWNAKTGSYISRLKPQGHIPIGKRNWVDSDMRSSAIDSAIFSPDGSKIATGGQHFCADALIFDAKTKKCLCRLAGDREIKSLAFNADSTVLASGSTGTTIRLWSVARGTCLHILEGHTGIVFSVAFSSNNRLLASGSYDRTIRLWNLDYLDDLETITDRDEQHFLLTAAEDWFKNLPHAVHATDPIYQALISRFAFLHDKRLFTPMLRSTSYAGQAGLPEIAEASSSSSAAIPEESRSLQSVVQADRKQDFCSLQ